ncbi:MAG: immune inhibitor A [Candidatus Promineifilaceae bacterium]
MPPLDITPPGPEENTALARLQTAVPPAQDRAQIAADYLGITAPRTLQTLPPVYTPGDSETFWVKNFDTQGNNQITAVLRYQSDDLLMWFEEGLQPEPEAITAAARHIETQILPTNRVFFGQEWQPGVDNDPRLTILHVADVGQIATAYFDFANEYVTAVSPYSNQREMLTVGMKTAPLNSNTYFSAIAHELFHLIQWGQDSNESGWLSEGLAELAALLNGYPPERDEDFAKQTDIQLTNLSQQPDEINAHYAASTLFVSYLYDTYGAEAIQAITAHPENGADSIEAVLRDRGIDVSFADLFAGWTASLVATPADGSLARPSLSPMTLKPPALVTDDVHQFGTDFYKITGTAPVTAVFTGTRTVSLFPASAHSGKHVWFSYPADESAVTLTRALDLTAVSRATLTFWTWYDLEEGWDYGYTAVSTNNGQSWHIIPTTTTTTENPQGNNLGAGLTGISGNGQQPLWVQQTADLSPFAGQPILLQFLVVTDTAVHHTGLLIDDIAVPEISFFDDVEQSENDWQAAGVVRVTPKLPQRFIVQMILFGQNELKVKQLTLNEQQATWSIPLGDTYQEAWITISGATPVTQETAVYQLMIDD